jgi:iduronate 2-sulfatase
MGYSLCTDRYRFTRWGPREGATQPVEAQLELYDHQTDPHENKNLAGDPAHAETVKAMTALLDAGWRGALPST